MEQYKEFKKKLYNIINESTLFFNEKGVADALLADYVDECAAGLLKVALEEYGINELKENLKKYQQSIETKYNEWRNYEGMPEEAVGLSYAIDKFEELKLYTI